MSNIRIRPIGIAATAAAGILLAAAAPANATENDSSSNSAATVVRNAADSQTVQARTRATDPRKEVCVRGYQSGTLVRRRICQSQADWDRDGGIPTY